MKIPSRDQYRMIPKPFYTRMSFPYWVSAATCGKNLHVINTCPPPHPQTTEWYNTDMDDFGYRLAPVLGPDTNICVTFLEWKVGLDIPHHTTDPRDYGMSCELMK